MATPEERRVCREIMRLVDTAKLRLLEGINKFKILDDINEIAQANNELRVEAVQVIRYKNRMANAIKNPDIDIPTTMSNSYGYSIQDLKDEFLPIVGLAQQALNDYPNIARAQVDAINIRKPELVDDVSGADL